MRQAKPHVCPLNAWHYNHLGAHGTDAPGSATHAPAPVGRNMQ